MTDIVERLRDEHKQPMRPITKGRLLAEAAAEIKKLRYQITTLREHVATLRELRKYDHDEIKRLRKAWAASITERGELLAEIERLKEGV